MKTQIALKFGVKSSYLEEDFFVCESNSKIFNHLKQYPNWGEGKYSKTIFLKGEKFCGKTHLGHVFAKISNAKFLNKYDLPIKGDSILSGSILKFDSIVIDDIERFINYEDQVFAVLNDFLNLNKFIFITSTQSPDEIGFNRKDLISRLNAFTGFSIKNLDLELMKVIVVKFFSERQVYLPIDVINYICSNTDREFKKLNNYLIQVEKKSLSEKKRITIPFLKTI